ncbi:MAG: Ig-like domain-containing protein [Tidjanibacter sp.]|nr:Ig-like domain-containing protein [Tidjanibacter sp.]
MKKLMKSLMLFAAAAMALTSCDNEGLNEGIENNDTFTLAFTADAPQSRTSVAISGEKANFSWSVDENGALTDRVVFLQTQNANNNVNTKYSDKTESSIKDGVATFVTEFTAVEGATSFNYCAVYPAQNISSNVTLASVGVSLPATQTLTEDTYAPAADLMMSKVIEGVTAKDGHGGNLEFTRLAAIGKMTLKGITTGETIESVKLTFANHVLAGNVTLNFNDLTATYATSGSSSIELNNGALVAEEENVIYFTCFPGTYSGAYRVDVTTDVATYYKEGNLTKDLVFTAGDVTGFSAEVGDPSALEQKTFTKVTSNLTDGTYLLVYEAGKLAFDGELTTLDAVKNTVSVEITNNQITGDFDANVFEIAKVSGGYTIKSASGYYIGQTSNANGLASSKTTAHTNTISFNTDGTANIISSGGAYLRYNATSGQERFRYFKSSTYSSQKAIALYRLETAGSGEEVEKVLESITVTGATTAFAVGSEEFVFDGTVTAHYTDGTTAVVTDKATVDDNVNMATAGEYTVTVTYEGKTFEYTVTVSELPGEGEGTKESPYDITRAIAVITNAGDAVANVCVKGTVTSDAITYNSTYGSLTYYITDGTNKMQVYSGLDLNSAKFTSAGNLHAGDEVVVCGTIKLYNTTYEFNYNNYLVEKNCAHTEGSVAQTISFTSKPESVYAGKSVTVAATALTTVTYSSSDTSIATVDPNTGVVTGVAEGDVTITATAAAEGVFQSASISYTLKVNPEQTGTLVPVKETISFANTNQRVSQNSTAQVWKSANVTFTNNKASSSTAVGNYSNPVRLYASSTVSISAGGNTITQVVITSDGSTKYKTALEDSLEGAGYTYTNSGNDYTVTLEATEMAFSLKAQARFYEIEVTFLQ